MLEWIRKANIAEFEKQLAQTTDSDRRRTLLQLLAEEKSKEPSVKARNEG